MDLLRLLLNDLSLDLLIQKQLLHGRAATKRAGLNGQVNLHTLRHTFASHLVMQGVDLPSIQTILGHHSVSVTMIYSHLSPGHLAKTVEKLPY